MATQEARPFSLRLGLREYEISEEEFLHPGALVDSLLDDKICETGGFIVSIQRRCALSVVLKTIGYCHCACSAVLFLGRNCKI